uniref:Protein FAM89A n=1 Tax=Oryctolagus cuniculus TaxID=9986 RepID=G1U7G3_RABIT
MSLLCQLYSLYESIQEYKGACQAAASPDCSYALENGFFDEDEEYFQEQSGLRFLLDMPSAFASLVRKLLCSSMVDSAQA